MDPRRIAIVAAVVGLLTTLLVYVQVQRTMAPKEEVAVTVPVVMAIKPVGVNEKIAPDGLVVTQMPPELAPPGGFGDPAQVIGRLARFPILPGEPVRSDRLIEANKRAGLSYRVPEGRRAISVQVNEVSGIAGLVQPGDLVDILATVEDPELGMPTTITILQRVEVLAIAQDADIDPQKKPRVVTTLTVLVTPPQAERLALAAEQGSLRLALRGQHQQDQAAVKGTALDEVLQSGRPQRAAEVPKEPPPPQIVTVIRGSNLSQVQVGGPAPNSAR